MGYSYKVGAPPSFSGSQSCTAFGPMESSTMSAGILSLPNMEDAPRDCSDVYVARFATSKER